MERLHVFSESSRVCELSLKLPHRLTAALRSGLRCAVVAALWLASSTLITGCKLPGSSATSSESTTRTTTTPQSTYIYIASGTNYPGNGVTASTPSNVVTRYKENGAFDALLVDYSTFPGDTPVGLVDFDSSTLLVLVENTAGRRIDRVAKDGSGFSTYLSNATALNAVLRSIAATSDGGVLVSKSTAIEKFSSNKSRVLSGANPYVNAPAGTCATTATLITKVLQGPNSTVVYTHAAASPNNRIVLVRSTGYNILSDCLAGLAGPTANHFPTTALLHSSGRLLVAYGNNTGPVHDIYTYAITATTLPAGTVAYANSSILSGITAMAEMPDGKVIVASGNSTFNTIEQFVYDTGTHTLNRVGTSAFIPSSIYTRSISSILVSN